MNKMTLERAVEVLGINRRKDGDLREMARALSMMSWSNTAEENERLAAAKFVLGRWKAYQAECTRIRDERFRRGR
jgi:hypothetical protein